MNLSSSIFRYRRAALLCASFAVLAPQAGAVTLVHFWDVPEFIPDDGSKAENATPDNPTDLIDIEIDQPSIPTTQPCCVVGTARSFYKDAGVDNLRPQFGSRVGFDIGDAGPLPRKLRAIGGTTRAFKLDKDDPDAQVSFRISNTQMDLIGNTTTEVFFRMVVAELPNDSTPSLKKTLVYKATMNGTSDELIFDQVESDFALPEPDMEVFNNRLHWELGIVEGVFDLAEIGVFEKDHRFDVTYNWEVSVEGTGADAYASFYDPFGLDGGIELGFAGLTPIPLNSDPVVAVAAVPLPTPLWALLAGVASLASFGRKRKDAGAKIAR